MATRVEDHEKSRVRVCGICFGKPKPKQHVKITETRLSLIKQYIYDDYSLDDISLPLIMCTSCLKTIKVMESGNVDRKIPDIDYKGMSKPPAVNTRSGLSEKCCCSLCTIVRMNGSEYLAHEKSMRDKPGRPKVKEEAPSVTVS